MLFLLGVAVATTCARHVSYLLLSTRHLVLPAKSQRPRYASDLSACTVRSVVTDALLIIIRSTSCVACCMAPIRGSSSRGHADGSKLTWREEERKTRTGRSACCDATFGGETALMLPTSARSAVSDQSITERAQTSQRTTMRASVRHGSAMSAPHVRSSIQPSTIGSDGMVCASVCRPISTQPPTKARWRRVQRPQCFVLRASST